jgi:antitoxin component YwqK of YwqJK toxin-antitoxin module
MKLPSYCLIFYCLILFSACDNKPAIENFDLTGYIEEETGRGSIKKVKKTVDGFILSEGYLKNNQRHGNWIEYYPGTQRIKDIMHFEEGQLSGAWFRLNNLGRVETMEQYFNGMLNGMKIQYFNGVPTEIANYKDNQHHGLYQKFYKTGTLQQAVEYEDGAINGFFRHYNEEGRLTLEYLYRDGEKIEGGIIAE